MRRIIALVSGTALGQIIIFAATPVLTRIYSPSDFGVLATIMAIIIVFNVFGSLRLELAIPLVKEKQLKDMIGLNILILVSVSLLSGILVFFLLRLPNFQSITVSQGLLIPVGVLLIGLYQVFSYTVIRENNFNLLAKTKINQSIGLVGTQIVLGLIKSNTLGLLIGEIVGRFYGLTLILKKKRNIIFNKTKFNKKRVKLLFFKYIKFPLFTAPASVINSLGVQSIPIFLVYFYSPIVGGLYAITNKLIRSPIQLIGKSIAQVFYGQISEYSDSPNKIKKLFIKMNIILFAIGLLITFVMLIIKPLIFNYLLGPEWKEAEPIFNILVLLISFQISITPLSEVLNVIDKQEVKLTWDVLRLVILVFIFITSDNLQLTYLSMFKIYALSMALLYIALFILCYISLKKYIEKRSVQN